MRGGDANLHWQTKSNLLPRQVTSAKRRRDPQRTWNELPEVGLEFPSDLIHAGYSSWLACENNRFSSLFAAGDVSRETSPAAKSEEKRLFSQATSWPTKILQEVEFWSISWTRIHRSSLFTTCLFFPTLFFADYCINHINRHFNELEVPEGQGRFLPDITASPILFFHEPNRFLDYLFYGMLRSSAPTRYIQVNIKMLNKYKYFLNMYFRREVQFTLAKGMW